MKVNVLQTATAAGYYYTLWCLEDDVLKKSCYALRLHGCHGYQLAVEPAQYFRSVIRQFDWDVFKL